MRRWVLYAVLLLACASCVTAQRITVIQHEVATIGSIALLNASLTSEQRVRLVADVAAVHSHLEGLK